MTPGKDLLNNIDMDKSRSQSSVTITDVLSVTLGTEDIEDGKRFTMFIVEDVSLGTSESGTPAFFVSAKSVTLPPSRYQEALQLLAGSKMYFDVLMRPQ